MLGCRTEIALPQRQTHKVEKEGLRRITKNEEKLDLTWEFSEYSKFIFLKNSRLL